MEHMHTEFVAASPDRVFDALAKVENLPRYVPQLTGAERVDGERISIHARYDGHSQEGEAWFKADADAHRIEWGAPGSEYHGSIDIQPEGEGAVLSLHLSTVHAEMPESDVMGTLDAIRRLVEADM
jgi:uncharacterized protein YndB with AHSA1/START domain